MFPLTSRLKSITTNFGITFTVKDKRQNELDNFSNLYMSSQKLFKILLLNKTVKNDLFSVNTKYFDEKLRRNLVTWCK